MGMMGTGMGTKMGMVMGMGNGNRNGNENKLLTIFLYYIYVCPKILYVPCKRHGDISRRYKKSTLEM
jgi:hypothetical protein